MHGSYSQGLPSHLGPQSCWPLIAMRRFKHSRAAFGNIPRCSAAFVEACSALAMAAGRVALRLIQASWAKQDRRISCGQGQVIAGNELLS